MFKKGPHNCNHWHFYFIQGSKLQTVAVLRSVAISANPCTSMAIVGHVAPNTNHSQILSLPDEIFFPKVWIIVEIYAHWSLAFGTPKIQSFFIKVNFLVLLLVFVLVSIEIPNQDKPIFQNQNLLPLTVEHKSNSNLIHDNMSFEYPTL